MSVNKMAFLIIGGALLLVGAIWVFVETPGLNPKLEKEKYTIEETWEMPTKLEEISGITWIGDNRMACVQDEEGIIFIYNLATSKIDKQIKFGNDGDYEALAVVDSTAYVVNSEGIIFEVSNYLGTDTKVQQHETFFTGKSNIEAVVFDPKNNRLLITTKGDDPKSETEKGIYAFNLETKQMETEAVFTISQADPIFQEGKSDKKKVKNLRTSEIGIHPKNRNIFLLQANPSRLLELDAKGKPLKVYNLDLKKFSQPEGLTFSPEGALYISNEGKSGSANILKINLDN